MGLANPLFSRGVLLFMLLAGCCLPSWGMERTARFYKGEVKTRTLDQAELGGGRRSLLQNEAGEEAKQAIVVGYEDAEEDKVAAKLAELGALIMQPVPQDHWIVSASASDIEALQAAFPNITVSTLPSRVKSSENVVALVEVLQGQASVASVSSSGAHSGGDPAWLTKFKDLQIERTSDGKKQVVIAIQSTPFASLGAITKGLVDVTTTSQSADAWAAGLAARLRNHLSLPASNSCAPRIDTEWVFGAAGVRVCAEHAPTAAAWLLAQPTVVWVDLQQKMHTMDLHASVDAQQSGALRSPLTGDAASHLDKLTYWQAGLTGKGQVTGITDTGVDMDSCHFWDPDFPGYSNNRDNIQEADGDRDTFLQFNPANDGHRKVDAYFFSVLEQNAVDNTGHGTHVASTVVGSAFGFDPLQNPDYATGVAPEAKLSFFDIESEEAANEGTLVIPRGIEMLHAMYKQGVKIISNSWGGSTGSYTGACTLWDAYTWYLQDLTIIAASGNEGLKGVSGDGVTSTDLRRGTIAVPGSCKNVMSVGAAENWSGEGKGEISLLDTNSNQVDPSAGFFDRVSSTPLVDLVEFKAFDVNGVEKDKLQLRLTDGILDWPNQASLTSLKSSGFSDLVVERAGPAPSTACSSSSFTSNRVLVFTSTSNCSPSTQGNNVIDGNSLLAGIMVDANSNLGSVPTATLSDTTKPFGYVRGSDRLLQMLDNNDSVRMRVITLSPQENVATFSSFGALEFEDRDIAATQDLRTQPTVVAPGFSLSASNNGYTGSMDSCLVDTLRGSSMSAPVVSGVATIIRQYFVDGYYPSGAADSTNGFEPSAALIQAMIIGATESMIGNRGPYNSQQPFTTGPLLNLPSQNAFMGQHTGWGRVSLRGLKLANNESEWGGLQVLQKASFMQEKHKHKYTISATGTAPLIVTLAYMDYPSNPNVRPLLVNDLDLKVTKADGTAEAWGNGYTGGDPHNNIEKVRIDYPDAGDYTIEVIAYSLFTEARPQPYALAVMGGIDGEIDSPYNPARTSSAADQQLQGNERMLRVRFKLSDLTAAQEVASNYSHNSFEQRTVDALSSKTDSAIVASVSLTAADVELAATRRSLLQSDSLVAQFTFTPASGVSNNDLGAHIRSNVISDFPLSSESEVDAFFDAGFYSEFSVTEVEGDVEPSLPLSSIYRPPPPASLPQQEQEEDSGSVQGVQTGIAALLGCLLLGLMVMLP